MLAYEPYSDRLLARIIRLMMKYPNLVNWALVLVSIVAVGYAALQTFWDVTPSPPQPIQSPKARTVHPPKPSSSTVSPSGQPAGSKRISQPASPNPAATSAASPVPAAAPSADAGTITVIRTDSGSPSQSGRPDSGSEPSRERGREAGVGLSAPQPSRSSPRRLEVAGPSLAGRSAAKKENATGMATPPVRSSMPEQRPLR